MGGMGIHFDLAEAKLAPPPTRPGAVAKADVIRRLSVSRSAFATVVAPAGYGKTTLVAHWAELDERQFAWVSLDARDDDAVVFMRYIAAAVDRIEPMTPDVVHALSGPGRAGWTTRVPPLGNALASLDRPIVLVLDDLHSVGDRWAPRSPSRAGKRPSCRCRAGEPKGGWTRSACPTFAWTRTKRGCCWTPPVPSSARTSWLT